MVQRLHLLDHRSQVKALLGEPQPKARRTIQQIAGPVPLSLAPPWLAMSLRPGAFKADLRRALTATWTAGTLAGEPRRRVRGGAIVLR